MDRYSALSDPNRRRIVEMLALEGELPATTIAERFTISAPAVSQHLKALREADLVRVEKRAQQRLYSINPDGFDEMWAWLGKLRGFWNARLDALDGLLREQAEDEGSLNT